MSDQWLYRICGQEFGPVALDLVRSLVATGTIAPDDEVRDATRSNWILACAATELRDSIKSPISDIIIERREARDEWFCRGATGEMGPLKLIDLIKLAAKGELSPDEEIKAKADDYWKQVSSIQRLVELLPFPDDQPRSPRKRSTPSDEEPQVILFPGVSSSGSIPEPACSLTENSIHSGSQTIGEAVLHEPEVLNWDASRVDLGSDDDTQITHVRGVRAATRSQDEDAAMNVFSILEDIEVTDPIRMWGHQDSGLASVNSQWTGWIDGKEFGPVDFTELLTWAVTGRLSAMDFVRRGQDGQFVPAVNIPCLFTVRAVANSLSRPAVLVANTKAVPTANLDRVDVSNPNPKRNEPAIVSWPMERLTKNDATSFLKNAATDPTSVGVSAMLTIGLVILGWVAFQ